MRNDAQTVISCNVISCHGLLKIVTRSSYESRSSKSTFVSRGFANGVNIVCFLVIRRMSVSILLFNMFVAMVAITPYKSSC